MNFKEKIADTIIDALKETDLNINSEDILKTIEEPKEKSNGDFSFPCFRFSKELKKSPVDIANQIKNSIKIEDSIFERVDVAGGFLN